MNLAKNRKLNTPTWDTVMLSLSIVSIVACLVLVMFVPNKKKRLKNVNNNKSYSLTSDYILNFTGACMITFAAYALGKII